LTKRKPLQLRLPPDLKTWITAQAEATVSSQNSEIIRAIRERMDCVNEAVT
jgi:hypothetical protein